MAKKPVLTKTKVVAKKAPVNKKDPSKKGRKSFHSSVQRVTVKRHPLRQMRALEHATGSTGSS